VFLFLYLEFGVVWLCVPSGEGESYLLTNDLTEANVEDIKVKGLYCQSSRF